MESEEKSVLEFQYPDWMCDIGLLVDISATFNELIVVFKANSNSFTLFTIPSKVFRRNLPYGNAI
jgi:hypothetical protein